MPFAARLVLPRDPEQLAAALEGRIAESRLEIERGLVGGLYQSGVRYRREDPGREDWQTAAQTFALGYGDCEDLVIWRVAELRDAGIDAWPIVLPIRRRLWHVVVEHADGYHEDPSAALGMLTPAIIKRTTTMEPEADIIDTPYARAAREADEVGALDDAAASIAAADADAQGVEASPEAIRPSVRWATTPRKDGTHDATVAIALRDGRTLRPTVHARTRRAALARAAMLARKYATDPRIAALIPPQAKAAVHALQLLGQAARAGRLANVARRVVRSRALRRVVRALW